MNIFGIENRERKVEEVKCKLMEAEISVGEMIRELMTHRIDRTPAMDDNEIAAIDADIYDLEKIGSKIKEARNEIF